MYIKVCMIKLQKVIFRLLQIYRVLTLTEMPVSVDSFKGICLFRNDKNA